MNWVRMELISVTVENLSNFKCHLRNNVSLNSPGRLQCENDFADARGRFELNL